MAMSFAHQFAEKKSKQWLIDWFPFFSYSFLFTAFTGFVASAIFVVSLFSGGNWDIEQWGGYDHLNVFLAIAISGAITVGQYIFYRAGISNWILNTFKIVLILYAFGTEVAQTMEREDTHVKTRSVASPTYQATIEAIKKSSANYLPSNANLIASAEAKAAQARIEIDACPRYLKGKTYEQAGNYVKHLYDKCMRIEQGNLAQAEAKIKALTASDERVRVHASNSQIQLINTAQSLSYDERHHFSVIRLLKEQFQITSLVGALIIAAMIIGSFEGVFYFLGSMVYSIELCLRAKGYNTKGVRLPEDDLIIENTQERVRKPYAYTGSEISGFESGVLDSVYPGIEKAVKEGRFKPNFENVVSALKSKSNMREDIVQDVADQVIDRLFREGLIIRTQIGNSTTNHVRVQPQQPKQKPKPEPSEEDILESIYADYLRADALATTARPQKQWLSQHIKEAGLRRNISEIQKLVSEWMERAYQDGVMVDNPEYQTGKNVPRYIRRSSQLRTSVYA